MAQLLFSTDTQDAKRLSRAAQEGKLTRIHKGIYTDATWEKIPALVLSQWYAIVDYLRPNAIATHSTAALLTAKNGVVYVTDNVKVRKKIVITNTLTIALLPGNTELLTEPFVPHLMRSSAPRYLMENLSISHKDTQAPKSLGKEWVETELSKLLERYGETELNRIRDTAKSNAEALHLTREYKILDTLIGALLSTKSIDNLQSKKAISLVQKVPFDDLRLQSLNQLVSYLQRCDFKPQTYQFNQAGWRNLSFYESYFSNYIEGTEFEIDEAEQIVFEHHMISQRHQDSHDVLSVFEVVNDYTEMSIVPDSPDELIALLKKRHEMIMHQRPDKNPGQFKTKANKAGDSFFVLPEQVEGTLVQSFELYKTLPEGIHRAIFLQFLVTECHPFDDGNGRLARIMLNAELVHADQHKLIVPTVHRESYLNGLRQATRHQKYRTMTKVFADLQAYTATIPWIDYADARSTLEAHYADKLPDQGVPRFNKQLAKLKIQVPMD